MLSFFIVGIIKKAINITRWIEKLFTFAGIGYKNLYNMKNKKVKLKRKD